MTTVATTTTPARTVDAPAPRALLSRPADFWLLGGASVIVWAALGLLQHWKTGDGALASYAQQRFASLGGFVLITGLIVNQPHFIASYRLGYGRGGRYVLAHWRTMILVPLILLAAFAIGYLDWGDRGKTPGGALPWLVDAFTAIGLNPPIHAEASLGGALMTIAVQTMWLTVGWHYAKQVYGCMMVYASLDGYPLDRAQRNWIRATLHAIWITSWISLNLHRNEYQLFNVPFYGLHFPHWLFWSASAATLALSGVAYVRVVRANLDRGARPSANFLIPWIAFVTWWFPLFSQDEFSMQLVPVFHALQYLPFVLRVERATAEERPQPRRLSTDAWLAVLVVALVAVGTLVFDLVPGALDSALGTPQRMNAFFFAAAFSLFINIHHYFLDASIWKIGSDPVVRDRLLGHATG